MEGSEAAENMQRVSFKELLAAELKLDPCQWEERPKARESRRNSNRDDPQFLEVDSLVHSEWLSGAARGQIRHVYVPALPVCQEEIHWWLQPSCDTVLPHPWQRVHITCIRKPFTDRQRNNRLLVPQSSGFSLDSIHDFLTQVSQENLLVSWRELLQLLHQSSQQVSLKHSPTSTFVKQLIQQLYNVKVKHIDCIDDNEIEKSDCSRSRSRSRSHHASSSDDLPAPGSSIEPEHEVHANLMPLLSALESKHAFYLIYPYMRFTLFDATVHSPAMLEDSLAKPLFVLFQLIKLLDHCHSKGITLGEINLKSLFIDSRLWVKFRLLPDMLCPPHPCSDASQTTAVDKPKSEASVEAGLLESRQQSITPTPFNTLSPIPQALSGSSNTLTSPHPPQIPPPSSSSVLSSYVPPALHLSEATKKWRCGELSNFDYLMLLNHHAGRCVGDPNNHPIFPWVMDFTRRESGYRELNKSKHLLSKGERQLDFTYFSAQEELRRVPDQDNLIAHHIGGISSDVTYYVYLARKTPKEVLCSRVRPRWVPEEYPASMEKMYIWTPDEAIPEFYTDTTIFKSIHPDLPDLDLPDWASTPEEFIRMHRSVLEGDYVSSHLHHWIDLVFGYKLSGHDAVKAKNVYLSLVDKHKNPTNCGIVQLFKSSHPKRIQTAGAPYALSEHTTYLNMSSVRNITSFPITQLQDLQMSPHDRFSSPQPNHGKTLESILSARQPPKNRDQENLHPEAENEELEDSYEHVALPDGKLRKNPAVDSISQNDEIGINYGDVSSVQVANEKTTKSKEGGVLPSQSTRFRVPVPNLFRPKKANPSDTEVGYDWQTSSFSLPKDSHLLDQMIKLEELANFVNKSCKDDGGLFQEKWSPNDIFSLKKPDPSTPLAVAALQRQEEYPGHLPSFEERVAIDITAVVCTVIEMTSIKQLRAAIPANATLLQRVTIIRQLLKSGQLRLSQFLLHLADLVLSPETEQVGLNDLKVPVLSCSFLLQPFLPAVAFPSYFELLYKFVSRLEHLSQDCSFSCTSRELRKWALLSPQLKTTANKNSIEKVMTYITGELDFLLNSVSHEGFLLLLLHLLPFLQYPETSFDAMYAFLTPLSQHMTPKNTERIFSAAIIQLFDSATEPHQRALLLSRTTANLILNRLGLRTFLNRFLGFYMDAVIEPMRTASKVHSSKRFNANIIRMQSQSMLVASDMLRSQNFERKVGTKQSGDLSFSMALSEHYIDSDKENSSEDSDDELFTETSLLAKPGMYPDSSPHQAGGSEMESVSTDSLLAHTESISGESAEKTTPDQQSISDSVEAFSILSGMGHEERLDSPSKMDHLGPNYNSLAPPDSPTRKSLTLSFTSVFSEDSAISDNLSSSVALGHDPDPQFHSSISTIGRLTSLPLGLSGLHHSGSQFDTFSTEEDEEEEEEGGDKPAEDAEKEAFSDPHTFAVNVHLSQVAADCISWLMKRLGPLVATRHIAKPMVDSLHRCFMGVLHTRGREKSAIKCLSSFAEYYGESVILKFYLPHAENLVQAAIARMTTKSEAGVAASLALAKLSIKLLAQDTLETIAQDFLDKYFIPLIQLLSSQTTFPSSGKARAAICHSMVQILVQLGERLGRELASQVLISTLQCFFACFSGVHEEVQLELQQRRNSKVNGVGARGSKQELKLSGSGKFHQSLDLSQTPTNADPPSRVGYSTSIKITSPAEEVQAHPLAESVETIGNSSNTGDTTPKGSVGTPTDPPAAAPVNEAYTQVCLTFSPTMAHASYIPFCRLLGQYNLNGQLYNTDLIEHIVYKLDDSERPKSPIPTVFYETSDTETDRSSETEDDDEHSDSESGFDRDAALKVGPIAAITGLSPEATDFGKSSWFVDLDSDDETTTKVEGEAPNKKGLLGFWSRSPSDGVVNETNKKSDSLNRHSAMFEAKFAGAQSASSSEGSVGVAGGRGGGGASGSSMAGEDVDCTLHGNWSGLWENQLQKPVYLQEPYNLFRGLKLQTFTGHKSTIKSMVVSDSEHYFISGSRDKTVKVWSLKNNGPGSGLISSRLTYTGHQKPVVAVELLENLDSVVSCDGTVHLWDPLTGYLFHQFSAQRGAQFVAMKALPLQQPVIALATSDLMLRFIDVRMKSYLHLWKLQFPTGGTIRSLACSENWIAVGNQNGNINSLDLRTGELLTAWKPAEYSVHQTSTWNESLVQLKATCRGNLVTSAGNGLLALWKPTHGKLLNSIKGQNHTTHCLEIIGDQLISASTNGNIVIHDSFELTKASHNSGVNLRTRGLSALSALQENKLLLLGRDSGQIVLMA